MKHTAIIIVLIFMSLSTWGQKNKVLIYTRNGQGYVHQNIPASVKALGELCKAEGWKYDVSDTAIVFTPENLKQYKCIVFSNTNNTIFDTDVQREAFKKYIQNGGGFVGIHSACGSERAWPWFWAMLGGKFVRHPELQPFPIQVLDRNNPATKHLPETWLWEDEFYYMNQLNPDIHVLLAGVLTNVVDDKKSVYPGETFGQFFPLSWVHEYDGGRQFFTALGHKSEYYSDINFRKHLLGGMKWAMKVK